MFKILRIVFTVLSATCVLPIFLLGLFLGFEWAIGFAGLAILFFSLAAFCKNRQEKQEQSSISRGDFFHPLKTEAEQQMNSEQDENGE